MAHKSNSTRGRGVASSPSSGDQYCELKDDRERRHALVSRDFRIAGCRLVTVTGTVTTCQCRVLIR